MTADGGSDPPDGANPSESHQGGEKPGEGAGCPCAMGSGADTPALHDLAAAVDRVWGKSTVQQAVERRDLAARIVEHHRRAERTAGTFPAGLLRHALAVLDVPRVPWDTYVTEVVRRALSYRRGGRELSYARPSLLQAGVGFGAGHPILPVTRRPVPEVTFVVDTSGSMSPRDLGLCVGLCQRLLRHLGRSLRFVTVDAAVHTDRRVTRGFDAGALLRGGGGTNFVPLFRHLAGLSRTARPGARRPDVVFVATDGYATVPEEEPPFPVVWLLLGKNAPAPAPWGRPVWVDPCG